MEEAIVLMVVDLVDEAEAAEETTTTIIIKRTKRNKKRMEILLPNVEAAILPISRTVFAYTTAIPSNEEVDRGRYH